MPDDSDDLAARPLSSWQRRSAARAEKLLKKVEADPEKYGTTEKHIRAVDKMLRESDESRRATAERAARRRSKEVTPVAKPETSTPEKATPVAKQETPLEVTRVAELTAPPTEKATRVGKEKWAF